MKRTTSLRGRVVRLEDGEPIAGATVVVSTAPLSGLGTEILRATTGADGAFVLDGLPIASGRFAGTVYLETTAPGRARAIAGFRWPHARRVPPRTTIALGPGGVLHGTVVRDDDGPVAGARVGVSVRTRASIPGDNPPSADTWYSDRPNGVFRVSAAQWTTADGAGRFALDGVPADVELVVGAAIGLACAAGGAGDARTENLEPATSARIAAGVPAVEIVLRVRAPRTFTVRVVDPDGRPVRRATVWNSDRTQVTTGADGRASISIREGTTISADRSGFPPARMAPPATGSGEFEVRFSRTVSIAGRIFDTTGAPIARAAVQLWPFDVGAADPVPRGLRSGADGQFMHDAAVAGTWQVSASARGRALVTRLVQAPIDGVELRVPRTATLRLRIAVPDGVKRPATVEVLVAAGSSYGNRNDDSNAAADRGYVFAYPRRVRVRDGVVRLTNVAPGRSGVGVWARGFEAIEIPVDVAEGSDADLGSITLRPATRSDDAAPEWTSAGEHGALTARPGGPRTRP